MAIKNTVKVKKLLYFFGNGKAEGNTKMKEILGGKGANLAEMVKIGLPVPPGFTISAELCQIYYENNKKWPKGLKEQVFKYIKKIEKSTKKKFGDNKDPLLLSVRSGAAVSMPGMMDTILNIGLTNRNINTVAKITGNERFAWDSYRRFIQMFGDVVMGVPHSSFENELQKVKDKYKKQLDIELTVDELKEVVTNYKKIYKKWTKSDFVEKPEQHLIKAIDAVLESWNNDRAIKYREINNIQGLIGTGVNIQTMVFGNKGENSGTGVCFTRDPSTGKDELHGEFLINAQGEDVVAGIRTPLPISDLNKKMPKIYKEIIKIQKKLEKHYKDMQDLEFTIEEGKLYMLQTRTGKRTGQAAVKIATDMVKQKLINKETAINRINDKDLDQLLHPRFDEKSLKNTEYLTKGLPASPGAAVGQIVFSAEEAVKWTEDGKKVILCRKETSPEDVAGMHKAEGILTSVGGMTSHAAVVARGWGKCCVAGAGEVDIDYNDKIMKINKNEFKEGDIISIDGSTGKVYAGEIPTVSSSISKEFKIIMDWCNKYRKLRVRTNSDTPEDTDRAVKLGAEGIGLCRTEHMFFSEERLNTFRRLILFAYESKRIKKLLNNIKDNKERMNLNKDFFKFDAEYKKALKELLPLQRKDFEGIFSVLKGKPATIRLLDPPLHEFLPKEKSDQEELANMCEMSVEKIIQIVGDLQELNPMLGHRGCRLGITYPEVSEIQVRAIVEAAINIKKKKKIKVNPEIMVPLIGNYKELEITRKLIEETILKIYKEKKVKKGFINILIGTMIEIPRAAVTADQIAEYADFFSFGTNDLTQMGAGFSRDDAGKFLGDYVELGIYEKDPFQSLDKIGIGRLIEIAIDYGRKDNNKLKIGICGEHGGDPSSIYFCHKVGMDYVSCSPLRIPIAILASAQAAINIKVEKHSKKIKRKKNK